MITCIIFGSLAVLVLVAMAYIRFSESANKRIIEKRLKESMTVDGETIMPNWNEKDWTDFDNNLLAMDDERGLFFGVTAGKRKSDPIDEHIITLPTITRSEVIIDGKTVLEARAGKVTQRPPEAALDPFRKISQRIKTIELRVRSVNGGKTIPCAPGKYGISLAEKYHLKLVDAMIKSGTSLAPTSRKLRKVQA